MTESLESFKRYIGRSETATDVVTGSAMAKLAATLGVEGPASAKGDPIPPGWHGAFFPASHGRDYTTKVEGLPGLVVQGTLVSQLLMEMCRGELPTRKMTYFGYQTVRQIYDTGPFTIAGAPAADGREAALWAVDAEGKLAMTATAEFAQ